MPVYRFTNLAAYEAVSVADVEGNEAATGTTDNDGVFEATLDAGTYIATVGDNQTAGESVPQDGDVPTYNAAGSGYVPTAAGFYAAAVRTDDEPDFDESGPLAGLPTFASGATLKDGDAVLVGYHDLVPPTECGLYIAHEGAWTRHPAWVNGANVSGSVVRITSGRGAGTLYVVGQADSSGINHPIFVGEDVIVFRQVAMTNNLGLQGPRQNFVADCATTGPVTLFGIQTIDGVELWDSATILVKNQADANANGRYTVRVGDWEHQGLLPPGWIIGVYAGTTYGGALFVSQPNHGMRRVVTEAA